MINLRRWALDMMHDNGERSIFAKSTRFTSSQVRVSKQEDHILNLHGSASLQLDQIHLRFFELLVEVTLDFRK